MFEADGISVDEREERLDELEDEEWAHQWAEGIYHFLMALAFVGFFAFLGAWVSLVCNP